MAISSTLALALVLSARTSATSKAIDQFASKTANNLAKVAAKSEELMRRGFADLEVGKAIMRPAVNFPLTMAFDNVERFTSILVVNCFQTFN